MRSLLGYVMGCLLATGPTSRPAVPITGIGSSQDVMTTLRKTYADLERPEAVHVNVSDTLCFSFVPWQHVEESKAEEPLKDENKPVVVYLPGLDGFGISAATYQFPDLSQFFQFWRLTIAADDRSSFAQVVSRVTDFVLSFDKPVTIIGESCGGLIATAVAIRLESLGAMNSSLQGLVLVNPATSFDDTPWGTWVPRLTSLDNENTENVIDDKNAALSSYAVVGSLLLSLVIPDAQQTRRIGAAILDSLPDNLSTSMPRDLYITLTDAMRNTGQRLPADVLEHRVSQWLVAGCSVVNARLGKIKVPVLVVVGMQDRLLPSEQEASRLRRAIPQAETLLVKDRGHFVLDDSVNLTEAIMYSKIDPFNWNATKAKYDPILDWKLPDNFEEYLRTQVDPLKAAFSPVYFSTDMVTGKRWKGMGKIPNAAKGRPLLFVANHQLAGFDMSLFLSDLYEQRNIIVRGLAHPIAFMGQRLNKQNYGDLGGRTPGLQTSTAPPVSAFMDGFEKYGAVLVSPRNYYRVLKTGQNALLFPGGVAEAQSGNKSYPLFWPEKVDFVRTAARFNAIVVPLSAIGMVDSVNVLAEQRDLLNWPIVGERMRSSNANITAARFDAKNDDELFAFPLVVPTLPARNYFLFGKPIDTKDIDPDDRVACERAYMEAQRAVREGIDDLILARKHDSFQSAPKRYAYEQLFGKTAPSFPLAKLNK